jgi:hypothetical protein
MSELAPELAALLEAAEKVNDGPWDVNLSEGLPGVLVHLIGPDPKQPLMTTRWAGDAYFIVAARNAVPSLRALLAKVAEL